ncbi:MAG: dTDP-4-dehydrorhamnose 3,5-epimerase [Rhizomicrobium sp.]
MTLDIRSFAIDGPLVVAPKRFGDARGFFSETYNARALAEAGIDLAFVQDNHSSSAERGTVRGLHFQAPPQAQAKLVRVPRGRILDVFVDIRRGSPTYGRHGSVELSAENWLQILIPIGFAHGFCTLEPGTEVIYKTTDYWAPEAEGGIRWNDPALKIAWPDFAGGTLSDRDRMLPLFADLASPFSR